jgi:hypothetical protein
MGLKKNKIINIHLQNNYKTCCYGVSTVWNGGARARGNQFLCEAIKVKDFMIHDSFGMDLIIITELLPERLPQVTST